MTGTYSENVVQVTARTNEPACQEATLVDELASLRNQIQEKLNLAVQQRQQERDWLRQKMDHVGEFKVLFNAVADRLMRDIVRPRIEMLTEQFDNAKLLNRAEPHSHHVVCLFSRCDRYPASTRLDVGLGHDDSGEHLAVFYNLQILPVFIQYEPHDRITVPFAKVDEDRIQKWVNSKLVQFVDVYLRLEQVEQYQRDNFVTDPVCGMTIKKSTAVAHMEYEGKAYYFCVLGCKTKFAKDPVLYAVNQK